MTTGAAGARHDRPNVLVNDDFDDSWLIYPEDAGAKGLRVSEVPNGEQAVEAVQRAAPDPVVLNLNVPEIFASNRYLRLMSTLPSRVETLHHLRRVVCVTLIRAFTATRFWPMSVQSPLLRP